MKEYKITIFLKGGNKIKFKCTYFSATQTITGAYNEIKWENPDKELISIDLREVQGYIGEELI